MALDSTYTTKYIGRVRKRIANWMLDASNLEGIGEVRKDLYLKVRYLSAALYVITDTNNGLTDIDLLKVYHCMIKVGELHNITDL